jgi:hypothetical protein
LIHKTIEQTADLSLPRAAFILTRDLCSLILLRQPEADEVPALLSAKELSGRLCNLLDKRDAFLAECGR